MSKPEKTADLHPRNKHQGRYDLALLCSKEPALKKHLSTSVRGEQTIDFSDNQAVVLINGALLKAYYGVQFWAMPANYLCPPIPGRADYVHYASDILMEDNLGKPVNGKAFRALDIGCGANLIYPILCASIYGWRVLASDIDSGAVKAAKLTAQANKPLSKLVRVVQQKRANRYFQSIVKDQDLIDITFCNPPFFGSQEEAVEANSRKWRNLNKKDKTFNFGGQANELWCEGGELRFLTGLMSESVHFGEQILWFTALVSKNDNLVPLKTHLKTLDVADLKVVDMHQGQKQSRLIAWTFKHSQQRQQWLKEKQQ